MTLTCRELLDHPAWRSADAAEAANLGSALAGRVEKVLALAASALDQDGNPSLIASDDFAWAMTEVLRILDGKAGGAEK